MTTDGAPGSDDGESELVFSRLFDAPARAVFRAWTEPDLLANWWGPRGFSLETNFFDLRVGGVWDYVLRSADGVSYPSRAVFEAVEPPHRLVFFNTGGHVEDQHLTCRMVVTFDERDARTLVSLRMQFENSASLSRARLRGADQGGAEAFSRLADLLKSGHGRRQSIDPTR